MASGMKDAVSQMPTDPDISAILDGEENTLYADGLEIGEPRRYSLGTAANWSDLKSALNGVVAP